MADDNKRPDVTDSTVTEFFIEMQQYYLDGNLRAGNNAANIGVNLSPTSGVSGPAFSASAGVGPEGMKTGSFTVAVPGQGPAQSVLEFSKRFEQIPGNGLDVKSNVNANIGPMNLYAQREQPNAGSEIDTVGARGSLPFGPGTLEGGASRQFSTGQSPGATNYNMRYDGPLSGGIVGVGGNLMDFGGVTSKSIEGSFRKPLGGGELKLSGAYANPDNEKSRFEAMMRYKMKIPPFGG